MKVTVIQHIVTVLVGLKQIQHLVEYRWDEREIFLGDLLHFSAPSLNGLCEGREFLDEEPSHWSHSLRHESICVLVVADGLIVVREEGQGVEFRDLLKHLRRGSEVIVNSGLRSLMKTILWGFKLEKLSLRELI